MPKMKAKLVNDDIIKSQKRMEFYGDTARLYK